MRRRFPVLPASLACLVVGPLGLAGCFTTSTDYQRDAESFIVGDEDLRVELFGADTTAGTTDTPSATKFTSATCEDPRSQEVGTTFICSAEDDAGGDWEFEIEIQDADAYDVKISRQP